jgi:hypothetical protein
LPLVLAAIVFGNTNVARAIVVYLDAGTPTNVINDNGVGDLNAALGIVDFNTVIGNYSVQGTVDTGVGANLTSLLGSPSASLRLTNFTATAIGTPSSSLHIRFSDLATGVFTSVQGADSLDAYVGNAFAAAVPAGTDYISDWQGFMSGATFGSPFPGPPPYFNPVLPASSPPQPYTLVGHGPAALPGTYTNPVFGAYLSVYLGAPGDQLILNSSGEVGFVGSVPEPATAVLLALGAFGLLAIRRRR